ncbi:ATP-binding protein [Methanimicrococcus hongohii]|uniref:AAA family ATPase n=1 Tax=Methanimicrococcus hongohii TaxID=3028295 RepID=UPI00292FEDDF|nr:ATP-binding protein [Methanimicrococcus sp. Hf6]
MSFIKYSIEIGKIVEGALKHDQTKVINYTKQLICKLEEDHETYAAKKFTQLMDNKNSTNLSPMGITKEANLPIDLESRIEMVDVICPNDNDIEVILSKLNKEKFQSFILNRKNADKLNSAGIDVSNTLLLYGPPGCGKSKCAYLIAKELELPLVVARLDSLISSYLGTTAKNIRTLFEYAQKTPCVLFLDEFDAIAKARDDNNELGELKRVVNSLLQNVDSMSKDSLLIAATNHETLLDSAVWRRFDYKIEINLPEPETIIELIDLFTKNNIEFNFKEKKEFSILFNGLSGSDIEEIIKKAIRNSILNDSSFSKRDIYDEFFLNMNIIPQNCKNKREENIIKAKYLKNLDPIFSYSVIGDVLDLSKSTVYSLISEKGEVNE